MGSLIGWMILKGVSPRFARPLAYAGLVLAFLVLMAVGKCSYDRSVIAKHDAKATLDQAKRERTADANLHEQKGRDETASTQRQEEIDHATRNIPDQAPSARQRARACVELRRQAKASGGREPAC